MRLIVIFLLALSTLSSQAQSGYKLDFKVNGLKDTTVFLGYYYGESKYRSDTARVDKNGNFSFDGKVALPQGIYLLIIKKDKEMLKAFDLVIGSDQTFALETSTEDFVGKMKVTGDMDNKLFFDYMVYNMERGKEADPFIKVLQDSIIDESNKKDAREGFQNISKKVLAYQDDIIAKNPTTLTARFIKANKSIEIPEAPLLPNGEPDKGFGYRYYKKHYWDNFDVSDDALIRMPRPIYLEKLKDYLDKMVVPSPDSLIKEIDDLAAKARKNQETYKYLVWQCLFKYQNPEIMGQDAIFVHLYDKYFASKEMDFWINAKTKQDLKTRADQLRISLIGMTAPNLIMQDINKKPRNMYDIKNKYTILFIFDPDCGHCREETPKLVNFYNANKTKLDVEVFAVSADSSMKKMNDFMKEFKTPWITVNGPRSYVGPYHKLYDADQTPSLYVIDNRKKIIGKKPPIDKLAEFLEHHDQSQKKIPNSGK